MAPSPSSSVIACSARRPRRSQIPFDVGEHAQARGARARVGEREQGELDRVLRVHEHGEILADAVVTRAKRENTGRVPRRRSGRSSACGGIGPGVATRPRPTPRRARTGLRRRVVTGSLANGVRRFSRLFSAHVCAEPDAETTVPNAGLAMTLTQGSGVSCAVQDHHVFAAVVGKTADAVRERETSGPRRPYRSRLSAAGATRASARGGAGGLGIRPVELCASSPRSPLSDARATLRAGSARPRPSGHRAAGTRRPAGASTIPTGRCRAGPQAGRASRRGSSRDAR